MKAIALAAVGVTLWAAAGTAAALGPVRSLPSPSAAGSGEPRFTALADGGLLLSWIQSAGDKSHRLRMSELHAGQWSEPRTVFEGESLMVNGADFPGVHEIAGGVLVAHWQRMNGLEGYGIWVATSRDRGRTWSAPQRLHRDESATEHGFVSIVPKGQGALAVWLDGHNFARASGTEGSGPDMALHAAEISPDGSVSDERVMDSRVCDCCQTAAVATAKGALVAYRDRSPSEVRDISLVRESGDPRGLYADGWKIDGCPVNGPVLHANGNRVVAAWFTAPLDKPRVRAAISRDGGATFSAPALIATGEPLGRVGASLLANGGAVVTWAEVFRDKARMMACVLAANGKPGPRVKIAEVSGPRWSGFPQVARAGNRVYFAWTVPGNPGTSIRIASATIR